jgi:hypothetical protein
LHRIIESEVPHLVRHAAGDDSHADFHQTLLGFVKRYRGEIAVRNPRMAAFVVGQIVHVLIHSAVIDEPEGLGLAAIERETVRAVLAYLTADAA